MSDLKFRFRWHADGQDHETIIEARHYPEACYLLAAEHAQKFLKRQGVPKDFSIDLTKPERVEDV